MNGLRRSWAAVRVAGASMAPVLRSGDAVLVRRGRPRAGDVVVGVFRTRPDLLVVKRAVRPTADGWWLESDNPRVTDDSRRFGPADVYGRVVVRWWPPRTPRRLGRRP